MNFRKKGATSLKSFLSLKKSNSYVRNIYEEDGNIYLNL